jgi:hypothetical protein
MVLLLLVKLPRRQLTRASLPAKARISRRDLTLLKRNKMKKHRNNKLNFCVSKVHVRGLQGAEKDKEHQPVACGSTKSLSESEYESKQE